VTTPRVEIRVLPSPRLQIEIRGDGTSSVTTNLELSALSPPAPPPPLPPPLAPAVHDAVGQLKAAKGDARAEAARPRPMGRPMGSLPMGRSIGRSWDGPLVIDEFPDELLPQKASVEVAPLNKTLAPKPSAAPVQIANGVSNANAPAQLAPAPVKTGKPSKREGSGAGRRGASGERDKENDPIGNPMGSAAASAAASPNSYASHHTSHHTAAAEPRRRLGGLLGGRRKKPTGPTDSSLPKPDSSDEDGPVRHRGGEEGAAGMSPSSSTPTQTPSRRRSFTDVAPWSSQNLPGSSQNLPGSSQNLPGSPCMQDDWSGRFSRGTLTSTLPSTLPSGIATPTMHRELRAVGGTVVRKKGVRQPSPGMTPGSAEGTLGVHAPIGHTIGHTAHGGRLFRF
jgi:hypothetical protein